MAAAGVRLGWNRSPLANAIGGSVGASGSQQNLIVLWMAGGPSQMDTFDMKVGHENGGPMQETATTVPGMHFSQHFSGLAKLADHLAIVRSIKTKEGDHGRGTYLVRTGQRPGGPIKYPCFPANVAHLLSPRDPLIPDYVSVTPPTAINPMAFSSGFLGASHQPLTVLAQNGPGNPGAMVDANRPTLRVENLKPPKELPWARMERRRALWEGLQETYGVKERGAAPITHDTMFRRAIQLSDSELQNAFDIELEPAVVRESYGTGTFGQGCLMARRLVERGVPVVEVALGSQALSWDTHMDNFKQVEALSLELDRAWSQLMLDLIDRNLLATTTILWIGEFGRTPAINPQGGRDHFPDAWSCVMAGGRIAGGQVYGKTSPDGLTVIENEVSIPQILATVAVSCGVDPAHENLSELGRPLRVVESDPIDALLS